MRHFLCYISRPCYLICVLCLQLFWDHHTLRFSQNSLQWGDGRRRKKLKKRAARVPKPLSSDFYCGSAPSLNDAVVCADRGLAKLPKSKMKQLETVLTDSQTFVIYLFLADMNSLLNSKIAHHLNSSLQFCTCTRVKRHLLHWRTCAEAVGNI